MLERNDQLIAGVVARIQARRPLRAWSLIVTIYGDAVVPRGGSLWLGSLIDMMAAFEIGGGVVRTAMSRLAKDGWIERHRIGRQSYYRLSRKRELEFSAAAEQIYAPGPPAWDGRWTAALLQEGAGAWRRKKRAALARLGFAAFAPNVLLRPNAPEEPFRNPPNLRDASPPQARPEGPRLEGRGRSPRPDRGASRRIRGGTPQDKPGFKMDPETQAARAGALVLRAETANPQEALRLAAALWPLDGLDAGYRRFLGWFAPVRTALDGHPPSEPHAFILRIALIHEYRRLVLHDPALPAALLPKDWPGAAARLLCRDIYARVLAASERWLDRHAQNEHGPLPPPDRGLLHRFGGLPEP